MGILDTIKEKYKQIDREYLGGYLPGGPTPTEVRNPQVSQQPVQSQPLVGLQPSATPADVIKAIEQPVEPAARPSSVDRYFSERQAPVSVPSLARTAEMTPTPVPAAPVVRTTNTTAAQARVGERPISHIERTGKYEFDFFTPEGQKERIANMAEVMKIAINPFDKDRIVSNVNQKQVDWLLETGANNPYKVAATAAAATLAVQGIYSWATSTAAFGDAALKGQLALQPVVAASNTKTATAITSVVYNYAKSYAIKNPLVIVGLAVGYMYSLGQVENPRGDALLALSIAIPKANAAGDFESAEEMTRLAEEINNPNLWDKIAVYIPGVGYKLAEKEKAEAAALVIEANNRQTEMEKIKLEATKGMEAKIKAGIATEEEQIQFARDNPFNPLSDSIIKRQEGKDYIDPVTGQLVLGSISLDKQAEYDRQRAKQQAADEAKDRLKAELEDAQNARDEELARRFERMTDQEFINDPEIIVFTQDSKNAFSLTTKLYDQAFARVMASRPRDTEGNELIQEAPSTLNFGLLDTGGELRSKKPSDLPVDIQSINLNSVAQQLFGVSYDELTPGQRAIVDMREE